MFENIFGIATIPSIIIICYLAAMAVKTTALDNNIYSSHMRRFRGYSGRFSHVPGAGLSSL